MRADLWKARTDTQDCKPHKRITHSDVMSDLDHLVHHLFCTPYQNCDTKYPNKSDQIDILDSPHNNAQS